MLEGVGEGMSVEVGVGVELGRVVGVAVGVSEGGIGVGLDRAAIGEAVSVAGSGVGVGLQARSIKTTRVVKMMGESIDFILTTPCVGVQMRYSLTITVPLKVMSKSPGPSAKIKVT